MSVGSNIPFHSALGKLGMSNDRYSGLRLVSQRADENDPDLFLALEQANEFEATAVYFRFYNDNRPPKPQIYIYDESGQNLNTPEADIHHKLWNAGIVPFCFIIRASQILIYNCGKKPEWDTDGSEFITSPHDFIDLLDDIQQKLDIYNVRQFDSGLFWDSNEGKQFKYEEGAYEQLLSQLKNVKSNIISRLGNENSALVKRILMMLILIKYLEERKDEDGNGALNPNEFYKAYNPHNPTLEGVLENVDTFVNVLKELSSEEHFNGQIFYLDDNELLTLKKKIDLTLFQYFVRGDVSFFAEGNQGIGQMSLWRLYQFNYLPIELISHIYEDFLADENGQKKKGVVYTPPYLVQFLIDQCMPLKKPKKDFKILDPACGSGIFLVGAFKRMIQWWRVQNNWKRPKKENIQELKDLLQKNIFGCDLEDEAVTLSYFSLGLALLDSLSPREIWRNVHFDDLIGCNLYQGDFFKTLQEEKIKSDFQLIIGNPPFNSEFTDWANTVDKQEKENNQDRPVVPDNQIALLFLEQSIKLLSEGGNCCLILPSGPVLYNTNTYDFRKYLFEQYYIKGIFDFTSLRAKLFIGSSSSAKPAVVSVFAEKAANPGKPCFHNIFRRTKASGEKIDFEIDHYDIHKVPYKSAIKLPGVWQANFLGGGRLHQLLDKITAKDIQTVGKYLNERVQNNNWKVAEGWIESANSKNIQRVKNLSLKENKIEEEIKELNNLEKRYKADWITNYNYVETDGFTENGISKIEICTSKYFLRPRKKNKEIFQPPHLLIKESVTGRSIPVIYSDQYLTFKDKIFGIHSPKSDISDLHKLGSYLKDENCVPLMWLLSGQVLTSREGVPLKGDILNLPYPQIPLDNIEKILLNDIVDYYADFRKAGEKSIVLAHVDFQELEVYGKMYCDILNSIYDNFKPYTPIVGNEFIAYPFVLGDKPEIDIPSSIEEIESKLKNLINSKQGYNLWIKRIVKVYHKNVIFLYKPNQRRYWLPSIAVRDADETFVDLFKQGK
ncbi:class I SAM-dependent DNA methyltransferase [Prevotella sp. 10(H)]|uniref:HsdM family class I SAM-dependent methyltransferase n=1 Tax=Prevotella sp. 10(H) TaxID=1158294 RepID=UPI0004A6F99D|nr:N-6 DNA methylase [Prevotella sp. 10(H)]